MKFHLNLGKKTCIQTGIFSIIALALCIWSKSPLWILLISAAAYLLVKMVDVEVSSTPTRLWKLLSGKIPFLRKREFTYARLAGYLMVVVLFIVGPIFTTYSVQRIILENEYFVKTGAKTWELNFLVIFLVYLALLVLLNRPKWAFITAHVFFVIVAFTDYFVYDFRANEINWGDITTIGTGLSVASKYRFSMSKRGTCFILASIIIIALVRKFRFKFRHFWTARLIAILIIANMYPSVSHRVLTRVTQTWEKKGTYKNGFVVNFICGIRDSYYVDPPAGYSLEAVAELEEEYKAKLAEKTSGDDGGSVKPTIITIMDESFADFRLIGDLETNVEVTPFIDSLTENTTKGFAMASVFGAKTPNSEWEYLTGNTMAFLPGGSVSYQQWIDKKPYSMVSTLKEEGYTAVAMHPYFRTGWRRNTVYPKLGFGEMHFLDDGDSYYDETNILRDYITDEELFDKIINRFEQKQADEPLFIMSITMQNHGGYRDTYDNFKNTVYPLGSVYYEDASQYLSLIHETDKAVEKLITYFKSVDEPVEIVFFGDHYPSLSSEFVKSINGKGLSGLTLSELEDLFSVPFFIWTNYDSEAETVERTSLNYLHTLAYEKAGIGGSAYDLFLEELQEVIPSMNGRGYYSLSKKRFLHYADAEGEEAEWIRKYKILQYNCMFGKSDRSEFFFPVETGS